MLHNTPTPDETPQSDAEGNHPVMLTAASAAMNPFEMRIIAANCTDFLDASTTPGLRVTASASALSLFSGKPTSKRSKSPVKLTENRLPGSSKQKPSLETSEKQLLNRVNNSNHIGVSNLIHELNDNEKYSTLSVLLQRINSRREEGGALSCIEQAALNCDTKILDLIMGAIPDSQQIIALAQLKNLDSGQLLKSVSRLINIYERYFQELYLMQDAYLDTIINEITLGTDELPSHIKKLNNGNRITSPTLMRRNSWELVKITKTSPLKDFSSNIEFLRYTYDMLIKRMDQYIKTLEKNLRKAHVMSKCR